MKNFFLLLFCLMVFIACNNDDDHTSQNPIDQLPEATQTGENTFGCLLDGEVFLPDNRHLSLDCVYQFVDGGYYFALQGNRRNDNNDLIRISVGTNRLEINEDNTYVLKNNAAGNAVGKYFFNTYLNYTSQDHTGELTITYLDEEAGIVCGTFWFDVEDHEGVIHQIREGRFDMRYTN